MPKICSGDNNAHKKMHGSIKYNDLLKRINSVYLRRGVIKPLTYNTGQIGRYRSPGEDSGFAWYVPLENS